MRPAEGVGREYLDQPARERGPTSGSARRARARSASRCTGCSCLWTKK